MTSTENNDRRIGRTKKALKKAFETLAVENKQGQLTVHELVNTADVNRTTFYRHYLDVYDFTDKLLEEFIVELLQVIKRHTAYEMDHETQKVMEDIFVFWQKNSDMHIALSSYFGFEYQNHLGKNLKVVITEKWSATAVETNYYQNIFKSYGFFGIINAWIKNGMKETPNEMAKTVGMLFQ